MIWRGFSSEWLKLKRSLASWMILAAGLFTPIIVFTFRVVRHRALAESYRSPVFWEGLWKQTWESVAVVLLPLTVVVLVALVLHLEEKNNTWKQLFVSPRSYTEIYLSKLAVLLVLLVCFFVVLNAGMLLSALAPVVLVNDLPWPVAPLPLGAFALRNATYLLEALPVVAVQYLLGLRFRNVLVPVGVGLAGWLAAAGMLSWDYVFVLPWGHSALEFIMTTGSKAGRGLPTALPLVSVVSFFGLVALGLVFARRTGARG
jgi:lantibiotic transport system permease protein